jgi:thymidine kinase
MARIECILGPMFGGKSTELIRRCKRLISVGMNVIVLNHSLDTRNGTTNVVTHDGVEMECLSCNKIDFDKLKDFDVIAIDEAQFFENIAKNIRILSDDMDKHVIVAALSGDYKRKPWPGVDQIIALSDEIVHCKALCVKCHRPAAFTKKHVPNDRRVDIGADDKYSSVCRVCYNLKG